MRPKLFLLLISLLCFFSLFFDRANAQEEPQAKRKLILDIHRERRVLHHDHRDHHDKSDNRRDRQKMRLHDKERRDKHPNRRDR